MKPIYAALIGLIVAYSNVTFAQQAQQPPREGRYVILFSPVARPDTFLLDTATGNTWVLHRYASAENSGNLNNETIGWAPMVWLKTFPSAPTPPKP
jgi:hypothetical protein